MPEIRQMIHRIVQRTVYQGNLIAIAASLSLAMAILFVSSAPAIAQADRFDGEWLAKGDISCENVGHQNFESVVTILNSKLSGNLRGMARDYKFTGTIDPAGTLRLGHLLSPQSYTSVIKATGKFGAGMGTIFFFAAGTSGLSCVGKTILTRLPSKGFEETSIAESEGIAVAEAIIQVPAASKNSDAVAVIIGNRNYEGRIPAVDYAHNDADAIKKFVTELLGYNPDNIIDLRDATQAKLQSTFGNERTHQGKLWGYLDPQGGSDVVIYYSGHGVPGQNDGKGYLLPTNADPDHPEINGYPLDMLYANLGKLEARSITVLLDACFSGGSHAGTLTRSASSILVTPREIHKASGEVVVLTAASGDQLASWDEKAKQGLFTRYFFEAVYGAADSDADGAVNLEEVKSYLDRTMTRRARRDFLREQDAWVSGAPDSVLARFETEE